MKINQINNTNHRISFMDNSKQLAPLSQQQQSINFEQKLAQKADSVESNPVTSLGYKLYRTFRIITEHEQPTESEQQLNVVA